MFSNNLIHKYKYLDEVHVKRWELRIRVSGFQVFKDETSFSRRVLRAWRNGYWLIRIGPLVSGKHFLSESYERIYKVGGVSFSSATPVNISYQVGEPSTQAQIDEFINEINDLIPNTGKPVQLFFRYTRERKRMFNSDGSDVCAEHNYYTFLLESNNMWCEVSTTSIKSLKTWAEVKVVDFITHVKNFEKARIFNPVYKGSVFDVVLDPDATALLLHTLVKIQSQLEFKTRKVLGKKLLGNLSIYDDPFINWSTGYRLVDDEGFKTRLKKLVEDGVVIDVLGTRWTTHRGEGGGNAVGIFTPPMPGTSTLVVKKGDWKLDEIIEDIKSGFIVYGAKGIFLRDSSIELFPQISYYIERGEEKTPVKLHSIVIHPYFLKDILSISRKRNYSSIMVENYYISAITPYIRLKAVVR